MKYKIIADSSCDLTNDYVKSDKVKLEIAPLTIHVGGQTFIDDDNFKTKEMLEAIKNFDGKTTSSCPNPYDYLSKMEDAENVFIVTISKKLSGSYNSAMLSSHEFEGKNLLVIDSKGTSGVMVRIIDELVRLIEEGLSFDEIKDKILKFRDERRLYFVLDKFDNLVNNGRVSKTVAFIATILKIKPLCFADDGEINVRFKIRTRRFVIEKLIETINEDKSDYQNEECIISHCEDEETALYIKSALEKNCNFKKVTILRMKGLCSFYSLEKGIIVSI
jgi:DegV family protein with EDD domain